MAALQSEDRPTFSLPVKRKAGVTPNHCGKTGVRDFFSVRLLDLGPRRLCWPAPTRCSSCSTRCGSRQFVTSFTT